MWAHPSDTYVHFLSGIGELLEGKVEKITRYGIEFHIEDWHSCIQLSQVLSGFTVVVDSQEKFSGIALVTGLDVQGNVLHVEVEFDKAWSDAKWSELSELESAEHFFEKFISEWKEFHEIDKDFRLIVHEMQSRLFEIQRWLGHVERGLTVEQRASSFEYNLIANHWSYFARVFSDLFGRFEEVATTIKKPRKSAHRLFVRRNLHPVLLLSRFITRAFRKPLGYAGDFEIVRMIVNDSFVGTSLFSRVLNHWVLQQPPAAAHRYRLEYLERVIADVIQRPQSRELLSVVSVGAGPAIEIERAASRIESGAIVRFELIDFNSATIEYLRKVGERVEELQKGWKVNPKLMAAQRLIRPKEVIFGQQDLIYCAGLLDYLSNALSARLVEQLWGAVRPGGSLVLTNVTWSNPVQQTMEYLLEWFVEHRSGEQVEVMLRSMGARQIVREEDPTGVNVLIRAEKQ